MEHERASTRIKSWNRLGSVVRMRSQSFSPAAQFCLLIIALLPARVAMASEELQVLRELAVLDAASGYEGPVVDYIRKAIGGKQEVDNTGSLTASFGSGTPRIL